MKTQNFGRTRLACYTAYFTMSSIFALPPLLFLPLRETFGLSFTKLGTLVLVNFFTQLSIDLIFTLFSKYFNVKKVVRIMPLITSLGLATYALLPTFFGRYAYLGLVLGTVIFSVSAGLSEVLLSPVIAALPSDNPSKDMSMLHSLYAFGVFTVVVISTLFLKLFGSENWMILTLFWAALPIVAAVMFMTSPMPEMGSTVEKSARKTPNTLGLALCTRELRVIYNVVVEKIVTLEYIVRAHDRVSSLLDKLVRSLGVALVDLTRQSKHLASLIYRSSRGYQRAASDRALYYENTLTESADYPVSLGEIVSVGRLCRRILGYHRASFSDLVHKALMLLGIHHRNAASEHGYSLAARRQSAASGSRIDSERHSAYYDSAGRSKLVSYFIRSLLSVFAHFSRSDHTDAKCGVKVGKMSEAVEQYRCILDALEPLRITPVSVGYYIHAVFLTVFEY